MRIALSDLAIQRLKWTGAQVKYWDTALPAFGILVSKTSKSFIVMQGKSRKLQTLGRYPDLSLKDARKRAKLALATFSGDTSTLATKTLLEAKMGFLGASRSKTTNREYERYLKLIETEPQDITRATIQEALETLKGHPTAQVYAWSTYRAFLNWCVREQIITVNPIAHLPAPHKLESRDRVLSDEELATIWKHTDYRPFGHIVRCLMLSGQRRMEIAGAKPEWVTDVYTIPQTKNHDPHIIPLTPLLKQYLKPPFTFNGWSKAKVALDKKCAIEPWTLHDLRRTFSTNCARFSIPIHLTERILNHRSGTISGVVKIYNRYSYLSEMEDALLRIENHIRKITSAEA